MVKEPKLPAPDQSVILTRGHAVRTFATVLIPLGLIWCVWCVCTCVCVCVYTCVDWKTRKQRRVCSIWGTA